MSLLLTIAIDLTAIAVLAFALYFPRHHRRDLVTAFLGINIGVLAVSLTLGSSTIGAGLGLGLFGVLSIIRLRSDEIAQHEVAYYFAALALGLIAGLNPEPTWTMAGLMLLVIAVMFVADHPRLFRRYRQQTIELDRAFTSEDELGRHLGNILDARIRSVQVRHLDLVNDTTLVDVRFQPNPAPIAPAGSSRGIPAGHPEAVAR